MPEQNQKPTPEQPANVTKTKQANKKKTLIFIFYGIFIIITIAATFGIYKIIKSINEEGVNPPPFNELACRYNNRRYEPDESFNSTDGCNTCSCIDGKAVCTEDNCTNSSINTTTTASEEKEGEIDNSIIVMYDGEGSMIADEYKDYIIFSSCSLETSSCTSYLFPKENIDEFPILEVREERLEFALSGITEFIGVAAGTTYEKLTNIKNVQIIASYKGLNEESDGKFLSFKACTLYTSICKHFLLPQEKAANYPELVDIKVDTKIKLSGKLNKRDSGAGNHYFELVSDIKINKF
jgi:hypothetical protein